ncbi:hypothetical protein AB7714_05725 [Tardiphaga sp. 1201_B9_N1_1]|uniref:hypothetical protein n=1 Tax=unclassified Tardiphaga TaxID=2631404 RepID=UPI003F21E426
MPNDNSNFVVGLCTRQQGPSSFVEVRAQSHEGTITDISSSSHKMFGNSGEIEVRSARPAIKVGDWVLARPTLEGPPKRQRHVASSGRRLLPFEDLSGLYAPEAARRLLVETGRQDGFAGDRVFRIGAPSVIEVRMSVSSDGRSRIGQPDDLTALPTWPYHPDRRIQVPTEAGFVDLYAREPGTVQSGVVNWCSDVEFLRHVIGSFADEKADDGVLKQAAVLLSGSVALLESKLSEAERLDPRVGQEIMRSRRLADLLKSRDDMLRDFMNVLRSDPEIKVQLAERIEQLAEEAAEIRGEALLRDRTAALEADLQERRARGQKEIDETLRDMEAAEFAEMAARLDTAREAALADIAGRKAEIEQEVSALTGRRTEAAAEIAAETDRLAEAQSHLAGLQDELAGRKEEIDRLIRMETLLQDRGAARATESKPRVPGFRASDLPAEPIAVEDLAPWVEASSVLSAGGKTQCIRTLAEILAGGLPVLSGDRVDDFVAVIAECVGGGRYVAFDCDPAVITFDDLWVRPGSGSATALGEALAQCDGKDAVRLCVVRNVDRAAAHLWLDTLADKLRCREIPDNMLFCLTLGGAPPDAMRETLKRLPSVDTVGTMGKAAAIAMFSRKRDECFERQVNLSTLEHVSTSDAVNAAAKLMLADVDVGFADARFFARLVSVAKALLKEEADDFILASAKRRFPALQSGAPSNGKPGLRVIESGGASNA